MRSRFYIALIAVICSVLLAACDTDSNIPSPDKDFFMKLYGGDGDQSGVDLLTLDDGNFLLLGNSMLGVTKRIYLVKADSEGKILWQKKFGDVLQVTEAKDIEPISDGNFVILATVENSPDNLDVKLIRITADGQAIDSVIYGSGNMKNDNARSVTPLLDGGFIITGSTQHDTARVSTVDPDAFSNIFHFRCNASLKFDPNWYEFYGATGKLDFGTKVIQSTNDRFYVFGSSNQDHPGNQIGKINMQYYSISGGGIVSSNVGYLGQFNQDTRSSFVCKVPTALGEGYLIIGTKTSNTGATTLQVSKLRSPLRFNSIDDVQLDEDISIENRTLDAVSAAPSVAAPSGYFLLANELRSVGTTNIWLTKIDQSARLQWSVSLGSEEENDKAAAVQELPNGKIIVLGTVGIGDNQTKMALFKLNSSGRLQD